MRPSLVTGANGHLGNNLCRQLATRGEPVRAMIRASADPAALAGLAVENRARRHHGRHLDGGRGRGLRPRLPHGGRIPHVVA